MLSNLNDLNFQRKKTSDINPSQPSSFPEQKNRSIYDFILRQDTQIMKLEKEISQIHNQLTTLSKSSSPSFSKEELIPLIKTELSSILPSFKAETETKFNTLNTKFNELASQITDIQNQVLTSSLLNSNPNTINNNTNINHNNTIPLQSSIISTLELKTNSLITNMKSSFENQVTDLNKKYNDLDNDFNRLIESLKTQFVTINDLIFQIEENKLNKNDFQKYFNEHSLQLTSNNNSYKTKESNLNMHFNPIQRGNRNKPTPLSKTNDNYMLTHSQTMTSLPSSFIVQEELLSLRNEVNSTFDKIDSKLLTELNNQSNDIKALYQLINSLQSNNNTHSTQGNENSSDVSKRVSTIEIELSKKANIEQLNYALEAQAKINDALCNANRIARWSWSDDASVNEGNFIVWSIQNINTALNVFSWESENDAIFVNVKGIYKISVGVILNDDYGMVCGMDEDVYWVVINGETIMVGKRSEEGIILTECYLPIGDDTKVQVKMRKGKEGEEAIGGCGNAEAFLEIKKLI